MDSNELYSIDIFAISEGVWKVTKTTFSECCGKKEKRSIIIHQKKKPKINEIKDKWSKL